MEEKTLEVKITNFVYDVVNLTCAHYARANPADGYLSDKQQKLPHTPPFWSHWYT